MSGRLFDATPQQSFGARAILPQVDTRRIAEAAGLPEATASRALDNASAAFAEMEQQRQAVADADAHSQARSGYLMGLARLRETLRTVPPEEMEARWTAGVQALRQEHGSSLSSRAQRQFNATADAADASEFGNMADLRVRATQDRSIASATMEMDQLRQQASRDPANAATYRAAIEAVIADRVSSGAITETQGANLRIRMRSQLDEDAALALMNRSPGEALRALQSGRFDGLNPETRERMINSAEGRMAAQAARAEAAAAARDRRVAVEVNAVNDMMLNGFVPEERLTALRTAARGTSHEGRVATLERDSREIRQWTATPAAEQATRLTELRTRLEGGRGTPEEFEQFSRLSRITRSQQQDIEQNGLQRAVQDRIVQPLPALDFANPETMNARVTAAQEASAHYGRPVSPFTTDDLRQMVQRFTTGSTDDALAIVRGVAGISDPAVRAEAVRAMERARGDAGRVPAGAFARILEMERTGGLQGQMAARNALDALRADVSGAVERQGARPELQQALVDAQADQVQGVRVRAASIGGAAHAALVARDMEVIRRMAMVRMAAGEEPTAAVRAAQAEWNRGLGAVNDRSLAHVYFPVGTLSVPQATEGLRLLREASVAPVDPAMGQDAALAARQRAEAARRAIWINDGSGFALVTQGTAGPVVLRRATVDEVRRAAEAEEARQMREPPPPPGRVRDQPPDPPRPLIPPSLRERANRAANGEQPVMR